MSEQEEKQKNSRLAELLTDILRGVAIGVAFIIPGFSGGSVAAILGIYEKLVGAIADIFRSFRKSVAILLPIALGMIIGIGALLFPLGWALTKFPIPTVCLFVGLALGGLPSVSEKVPGKPTPKNLVALLIPLAVAASLSFLPTAGDVDLFSLNAGGYLLLVLIGVVGSCALVVPGISGSMLLLIFGYYNPLIHLVTDHLLHGQNVGVAIAVLGCTGIGILIGFFCISLLMKICLKRYPCGTYFAIIGFILGSVPTVFVSTAKDAGLTLTTLPASPWYWIASVLLLAVGIFAAYSFVRFARKKSVREPKEER